MIPPPKIVVKTATSDVAKTASLMKGQNKNDENHREDEKDVVAALAAMSNMCVLYRTHMKMSSLVKMIMGNYDSVVLNDSFSTSDSLYALWGTSVHHDRTPPRLKYNRAEILQYSQVVEPVAGYHGMSRLTVTYQIKNQNLGVLEYVNFEKNLLQWTQRVASLSQLNETQIRTRHCKRILEKKNENHVLQNTQILKLQTIHVALDPKTRSA